MNRAEISRRDFLGMCGAAALAVSGMSRAQQKARPNIVVIMADDMGYGDPQCYNPESSARTPNIDRLAAEGMRFTDAHTPSAVCTPTRYGLLTGRYCWRTDLKSGVLWGESPNLIEPGRMTLASLLKSQGYNTACVGKWHLGLGSQEKTDYSKPLEPSPLTHGFDYSYIIPASLDMPPYVYVENDTTVEQPTGYTPGFRDGHGRFWREGRIAPTLRIEMVLPTFRDKSVETINRFAKEDDPFFLYVPLPAPHTPWVPTKGFIGETDSGDYTDFVTQVDETIGAIMKALDENDAANETLIIVTSDNGAHEGLIPKAYPHDPNTPWRGQKADIYEGGHRVPFVVRWPGHVDAGTTNDQLVCLTDLLATFADMMNVDLPDDAGEDSYSFAPAMIGTAAKSPLRASMVSHSLAGVFALREGSMKYIEERGSGGFGWNREKAAAQKGVPRAQLYDLAADPGETQNLYDTHRADRERMLMLLNKLRDSGRSRP